MSKASLPPIAAPEPRASVEGPTAAGDAEACPGRANVDFVVASHEVLFQRSEATRCDACGDVLGVEDVDSFDGYGMPGSGVYLWARGDVVEREKAPLCASCASAIGMTALARWEIEEEEG